MLQNNPNLWKDIGRDHGGFFLQEVENHWRIKEAEACGVPQHAEGHNRLFGRILAGGLGLITFGTVLVLLIS